MTWFTVVLEQNVRAIRVAAFSPLAIARTQLVPTGVRPDGFMILVSGSTEPAGGAVLGGGVVGPDDDDGLTGGDELPDAVGFFEPPSTLATTTMITTSRMTRPPAMSRPRLAPLGGLVPPGMLGMFPAGP